MDEEKRKDPQQQEKDNIRSRERYATDPAYREKVKAQNKERAIQKRAQLKNK